MPSSTARALCASLLVTCAACAAELDPVDATSSALVSDNKLATNRISLNKLAVNKLGLNKLAGNKLAVNKLGLNKLGANKLATNRIGSNTLELDADAAGGLIASEGGRELLSYLVGCALPSGTTLTAVHAGQSYEFPGSIGLAPKWLQRPLDLNDQRWVSACLLARVNAHGVSVQISLRGPHRALSASAEEMAAFSLEEGAFWGNVFGAEHDAKDWNACRGIDQAAGENGDLVNRDCTEPDPANPGKTLCSFEDAGACGDFAPEDDAACRSFDDEDMHYRGCSSRLRKNPLGAPFERSGLVCGVARPRNTASIPAVSRLASEPTSLEMPSRGVLPQPASSQHGRDRYRQVITVFVRP